MRCLRIPFYGYFRLFFFLYLILPQTQGARYIYEEKIHPFLAENEGQIDDFIASAHNRIMAAGVEYLQLAIEYVKTQILGMPPSQPAPPEPAPSGTQTYTQTLLSRFSVPAAKWAAPGNPGGSDFYSLLSGAVAAATSAGGFAAGTSSTGSGAKNEVRNSEALIPAHLRDSSSAERMNFISAQRDRLNVVLSALDREAQELQRDDTSRLRDRFQQNRNPSTAYDGSDDYYEAQRPPSGLSAYSGLSKSRSEVDFEKIDADSSGAEDDPNLRRRNVSGPAGSSWSPWGWSGGSGGGGGGRQEKGTGSGLDY